MKLTNSLFTRVTKALADTDPQDKIRVFKIEDLSYMLTCTINPHTDMVSLTHRLKLVENTSRVVNTPIDGDAGEMFDQVITAMFGSADSEEKALMLTRLYGSLIALRDEKELRAIIGLLNEEKPLESVTWTDNPVEFPQPGSDDGLDREAFRHWLRS